MAKKKKIRFKNNAYYFRTYVTLESGERKQIERKGGKTEKEAERALIKFELEHEGKYLRVNSKMKLFDFLDKFFDEYSINWNGNSLITYKSYLKFIKNNFKNISLNRITTYTLQQEFNEISKKGYIQSYIQNIKMFLNRSFKYATKTMKILDENPLEDVTVKGKISIQKRAFTLEELKEIKKYLFSRKNKRYYHLFIILLNTGARLGEIMALEWKNIDFENSKISIKKSLYYDNNGLAHLNEMPKNKYSIRDIYVNNETMEIFKERLEIYNNNKKELKNYFKDTGFVFSRSDGTLETRGCSDYFSKLIKRKVNITSPTHSLRHTHASFLVEAGYDPKSIQERIGHKDLKTTLNIYTHISVERKKQLGTNINFFTKNSP